MIKILDDEIEIKQQPIAIFLPAMFLEMIKEHLNEIKDSLRSISIYFLDIALVLLLFLPLLLRNLEQRIVSLRKYAIINSRQSCLGVEQQEQFHSSQASPDPTPMTPTPDFMGIPIPDIALHKVKLTSETVGSSKVPAQVATNTSTIKELHQRSQTYINYYLSSAFTVITTVSKKNKRAIKTKALLRVQICLSFQGVGVQE